MTATILFDTVKLHQAYEINVKYRRVAQQGRNVRVSSSIL